MAGEGQGRTRGAIGEARRDVLVAVLATALVHAGLAWFALRAGQRPGVLPAKTPPPAMALVLVRRVPAGASATLGVEAGPEAMDGVTRRASHVVAPASGPRAPAGRPSTLTARVVERETAGGKDDAAPTRGTPLDDRWPTRGGVSDGSRFRPDPFERRAPPLPGGGPHRFRMRPPRSPADVVAGAASLLGLRPPGYEDSPCPRIARNVTALATSLDAGDRAALAHELEMQAGLCR
ncbi:hypothetical protein GCM10028862_15650 [Luteimonas pelagia]